MSETVQAANESRGRWLGSVVSLGELRWQAELLALLGDPVWRGRAVTHGDGRPVIVVPGFLAGDPTAELMRRWLRRIGYRSFASQILFNADCSQRLLDRLERQLDRVSFANGESVTLIGHSRGGHLARALSVTRPDLTRAVIALGSALTNQFSVTPWAGAAVGTVRHWHRLTSDRTQRRGCLSASCQCAFTRALTTPLAPGVPLTSIYTRSDGVIDWRACLAPDARHIEVAGSHIGLVVNRHAYRQIAAILAGSVAAGSVGPSTDA